MDLLLVRCADLESDGRPKLVDELVPAPTVSRDAMACGLSERGEKHSRRLATWLKGHAPRQLQIFSSPAKGARQMAGLIADGIGDELGKNALPPIVSRLLGPEANASDVLGAVGWPHDHHAALVVAHQPALGALASLLLTGQETPLSFKRGAIWWFSSRHRGYELQTVLRCALMPDLLNGSGRSGKAEAVEPVAGLSLEFPDVVDLVRMRLGGVGA
ncbi:MAG TPA: histidine phosphatase family protein [Rhodocyclaceae bacterium]|nr:histidine phosphatase family protein [Rhodocyclaceae bacterium]